LPRLARSQTIAIAETFRRGGAGDLENPKHFRLNWTDLADIAAKRMTKWATAASVVLAIVFGLVASWYLRFVFAGPTPSIYAARIGAAAKFVAHGELAFDGERFSCGHYPTVLNPAFSDYGAAYFGFIVLNPGRFASLPVSVKRFAYAHECGHQYVGYSEVDADCYAVRSGAAHGWLGAASLEEICAFFSRSKGSSLHLPGPQRCLAIRDCYRRQGTRLY
jgi:hypothetical protein